jgi:acyl carrier protein
MTPTLQDIQNWLVERFAALAQVTPREIDIDKAFADYALDSALAVTLTQELGTLVNEELSITLFWEYPTIRALAEVLASQAAEQISAQPQP